MKIADLPPRFPVPFANAATGSYIRTIPTTSADPAAASLTLGFPPDTFVDPGAGGTPPDGKDFNGILKQVTQWSRWQAAGGSAVYNGTFSTAIGGYPQGALVASAVTFGQWWFSIVDDNTTNPDMGGAGWLPVNMGIPSAGRVVIVTGSTAGPLEHILDGSLLTRANYPALWAYAQASGNIAANDGAWLKPQYSPGNGTTTFRIPDYRGYFLRGADLGAGVDPARSANTLQDDAMQGHAHVTPININFGGTGIPALEDGSSTVDGNFPSGGPATDGIHGTPRVAGETRPINIDPVFAVTTGLTA